MKTSAKLKQSKSRMKIYSQRSFDKSVCLHAIHASYTDILPCYVVCMVLCVSSCVTGAFLCGLLTEGSHSILAPDCP